MEQGQRRIPVQFAKRVVGRRMYGGQSTYIPLKVNQSGVIPIIFASSVLYFPALITGILPWENVQTWVQNNVVDQRAAVHIIAYAFLIIFFAYFYTAIAFNPQQQADIIRKQGGFIPGIRPGPPTERYLQQVLNRITLPGSMFLMVIAVIPLLGLRGLGHRAIPVRRHRHPHHGRCRPGDDEADRQPADDAELRGVLAIAHGAQGCGSSSSVSRGRARELRRSGSRALRRAPHLNRRHVPGRGRRRNAVRPQGQ